MAGVRPRDLCPLMSIPYDPWDTVLYLIVLNWALEGEDTDAIPPVLNIELCSMTQYFDSLSSMLPPLEKLLL